MYFLPQLHVLGSMILGSNDVPKNLFLQVYKYSIRLVIFIESDRRQIFVQLEPKEAKIPITTTAAEKLQKKSDLDKK